MISGFESRAAVFPQYEDYNCFRSANIKDREHLMDSKQELSTIVWETNLRRSEIEMKNKLQSARRKNLLNSSLAKWV